MNRQELEESVRKILSSKSYGIKLPEHFKSDESLFTQGIVDSFGLIDFINTLQKQFSLTFEKHEIHPNNLETISSIVNFIESKKGHDK